MKLKITFADGNEEIYESSTSDFTTSVNKIFLLKFLLFPGINNPEIAYSTSMIVKVEKAE